MLRSSNITINMETSLCPEMLKQIVCFIQLEGAISVKIAFISDLNTQSNKRSLIRLMKIKHIQSKKGGKDQESIQSSTTPDLGYHIGDKNTIKHHKQEQ